MLIKTTLMTAVMSIAFASPAFAGTPKANALSKLDNRLDRLERVGVIEQGSRLDRLEDRIDRREDRIDRRVNNGPRDRLEGRIDRRENRRDRLNLK